MMGRVSSFETRPEGIRLGVLFSDPDAAERFLGKKFGEAVEVIFPGENGGSEGGGPLSGLKNRRKAQAGERLRIELHSALESYDQDKIGFSEFIEALQKARENYDRNLKP